MTLVLDGFEILQRIGANSKAFRGLRNSTSEVAEDLVKRALFASDMDLATFRDISTALGEDNMALVLETLPPDDLRGILRTLDPRCPRGKAKNDATIVGHILDLAHARAEPVAKAASGKRARPAKQASRRSASSPLGTRAMGS
jgi:hypothetical protein